MADDKKNTDIMYKRFSKTLVIDNQMRRTIRINDEIRSFDENVDEFLFTIQPKKEASFSDYDFTNAKAIITLKWDGLKDINDDNSDVVEYTLIDDSLIVDDKNRIRYSVAKELRGFDTVVSMNVSIVRNVNGIDQQIDIADLEFYSARSVLDTAAENIPEFVYKNMTEIIDGVIADLNVDFGSTLHVNENGDLIYTITTTQPPTENEVNLGHVRGPQGEKGDDGKDGENGVDGFSPIIVINPDTSLTITDKSGTHTTPILKGENGKDGIDGKDGLNGEDGFSPTIVINPDTSLTITDVNGTYNTPILKGSDGENGKDGIDGEDGFSPIITINEDDSLTITDKNGTTTTPSLKGETGPKGDTATYSGANGIDVDNESGVISAKIDNTTIVLDANGNMSSIGGGSGGGDYSAGIGTSITEDKKINVNTDGTTISVDNENKLKANLSAYTKLADNTDFNTITTPGRYQVNITTNSNINAPLLGTLSIDGIYVAGSNRVSNLVYLNVEKVGDNGTLRQTVFADFNAPVSSYNPTRGGVFTRIYQSDMSKWSDWVMYAGEVLGVDGRSVNPDKCTNAGEYICYFIGSSNNWLGWKDAPFHLRVYKMDYVHSSVIQLGTFLRQVATRPTTGEQKERYCRQGRWSEWVDVKPGIMTKDIAGIGKVGSGLGINATGSSLEIGRINVGVDTTTVAIDTTSNLLKVLVQNLCGVGTKYNETTNKIDIDMDYIRNNISNT